MSKQTKILNFILDYWNHDDKKTSHKNPILKNLK